MRQVTNMSIWAALFALTTAAGWGGLTVESHMDCPPADTVALRLRSLLSLEGSSLQGSPLDGLSGEGYAGYRLRVTPEDRGTALRLRLEDDTGAVLGERRWQDSSDCAALAGELAVIAATWLTTLPPPARAPPALPSGRLAAPQSAAATAQSRPAVSTGQRPFPFALGLGAGLALTPIARTTSVFAIQGLWMAPRFVLGFGFAGTGSWQQPLAEGEVSWRRWIGFFDVGWQQAWAWLSWMVSGGVQGGIIALSGQSFANSNSTLAPEIAVVGAARVAVSLGSGGQSAPRLWLAARLAWGLVHYSARVTGSSDSRPISPLQIGPMLGIEFPLAL